MAHWIKSAAITNKIGERGSPCRTPLLHKNSFPAVPLSRTEGVAEFRRDSTHRIHLAGKPLALSISSTIENSTRSNAFSKSSFRITISLLDWWH
jgi:hypothetical protein